MCWTFCVLLWDGGHPKLLIGCIVYKILSPGSYTFMHLIILWAHAGGYARSWERMSHVVRWRWRPTCCRGRPPSGPSSRGTPARTYSACRCEHMLQVAPETAACLWQHREDASHRCSLPPLGLLHQRGSKVTQASAATLFGTCASFTSPWPLFSTAAKVR